jgi:hypothetical protein
MPPAQPGLTSSSQSIYGRRAPGFLRVVSPDELRLRDEAAANAANTPVVIPDDLGNYIRQRWYSFRDHRNSNQNSINDRLLRAQRMFEGQYDPQKLAEIQRFGGSLVYSRLVAVKCRGATSLLRDVYLGAERPWSVEPEPDPSVPASIASVIAQTVATQAAQAAGSGQQPDPEAVHGQYLRMMHAAQQTAKRQAMLSAENAGNRMDEILQEGGFYSALARFLVDLPLFPFAVIKGPTVRMVSKLVWTNKRPQLQTIPQMCWERVAPQDLYWDPGAQDIGNAEIIERKKLTRNDLVQVMDLPGYDQAAVRGALNDYSTGLRDWMDSPDVEQAMLAARESPSQNFSHLIDAAEYHGLVQGHVLLDNGVDPRQVPDADREYMVQSWVVGRYTIKTQISPSPRQRHPYYVSSFEKVPGTIAGHGLPDILEDLQEVANATLRALVNNMSIASGPQVVVNTELLDPTTNEDSLYPWKRWKVFSDPLGGQTTRQPITFFQPNSNAQELMGIYSAISGLADDISAIPRYLTGESLKGGAGRTASGLSMLMGNAQKVLQTVAANIDEDVIRGVLDSLYDMVMLTDTSNLLSGGEQIKVNGVIVALQKETDQQKRLQFLQITANPLDAEIVGEQGRAKVLRALAQDLGMPDDIVPDDDAIAAQTAAKKQAQMAVIQQNVQHQQADLAIKAGSAAAKAGIDPLRAAGALVDQATPNPAAAGAAGAAATPIMPGGGAGSPAAPPGGPGGQNNFRPPPGASNG